MNLRWTKPAVRGTSGKRDMIDRFVDIADWVSEAMGTPTNILLWLLAVVWWFGMFAFHFLGPDSQILPSWFTSNAFNFPLNTVTTLVELFIGFFLAAAANRSEKRLLAIIQKMEVMIEHLETLVGRDNEKLDRLLKYHGL